MKVEIMSIGTELLLGDIVNTNAQFLSRRLAEMGFLVYHQSVVGDNQQRIVEAFNQAFKRSDIVITTGGLGPTGDDLTRESAAAFFGRDLVVDQPSYQKIKGQYEKMNRPLTDSHMKQVHFPDGSTVLPNHRGTAPGFALEVDNKIIICLPGPPGEMTLMFEKEVAPFLAKYQTGVLVSRVLRMCGIGESTMARLVEDIISVQSNPTVAPYAKEAEVSLRITARGENEAQAQELIAPVETAIRERLGQYIYGVGETSLEQETARLLLEKNQTLALAESCTGGLIAAKLVNIPGLSAVFLEGIVTYSNEAKVKRVNVSRETLVKYGAVSEQTAGEMAQGVAFTSGAQIGLAVTGIAGPEGATPDKPVGLVYLGLYINGALKVKQLKLTGQRNQIRNWAAVEALNWLRQELLKM